MNDDQTFFLVAGAVGIYLAVRPGGFLGNAGSIRSDQASANGIGPTGTNSSNLTRQIGGAVLGAGCGIVASVYGTPAAGAAVAPVCAKIGSAIAPSVVRGTVFLAKNVASGTAAGAKFVAKETVAGLNLAGNTLRSASENPIGFASSSLEKSTNLAASAYGFGAGAIDRGLAFTIGKAPTPVKYALAPVVIGTKIANKTATVAVDVAKATTGAVAAGGQAVGGAVTGATKAVGKWLGF